MIDINTKIENIHNEILNEFKRRNDILLSVCESSIEKLFLLHILQYYYDQSVETVKFNYIVEDVEPVINPKNPTEKNLPIQVNFMEKGGCFFLFLKGLQIENSTSRYQILPQYSLSLDEKRFRLDIAILMEEKSNDKLILRKKYCIECDGHDFHSSKSQITEDNKRMRLLTKDGWIVLRYSGSEIYNINQSAIMDLDEIINKLDRLN